MAGSIMGMEGDSKNVDWPAHKVTIAAGQRLCTVRWLRYNTRERFSAAEQCHRAPERRTVDTMCPHVQVLCQGSMSAVEMCGDVPAFCEPQPVPLVEMGNLSGTAVVRDACVAPSDALRFSLAIDPVWLDAWRYRSMVPKLSVEEIRRRAYEWPKYALVEEGGVDLSTTIEKLRSSRSFYRRQLNEAYAFKTSTGADYSDSTDRFDEYARMERELGQAIAYLEEIVEALAR